MPSVSTRGRFSPNSPILKEPTSSLTSSDQRRAARGFLKLDGRTHGLTANFTGPLGEWHLSLSLFRVKSLNNPGSLQLLNKTHVHELFSSTVLALGVARGHVSQQCFTAFRGAHWNFRKNHRVSFGCSFESFRIFQL